MFVFTCLQVSLHPYILIISGSCALACITASSYPQVSVRLLVTLYPHILLSLCSCSVLCYAHLYFVCLLVSRHPHILISLGSSTPGGFWYPHMLTTSYP